MNTKVCIQEELRFDLDVIKLLMVVHIPLGISESLTLLVINRNKSKLLGSTHLTASDPNFLSNHRMPLA